MKDGFVHSIDGKDFRRRLLLLCFVTNGEDLENTYGTNVHGTILGWLKRAKMNKLRP